MTTRRTNRKLSGFTLIEMLVVVLIMGILLAVAVPLYLSTVKSAGENTAKANIKAIATAAQAQRVRSGTYPVLFPIKDQMGNIDMTDPSDEKVKYTMVLTAGSPASVSGTGVITPAVNDYLTIKATELAPYDTFGIAGQQEITYRTDVGALSAPATIVP